METGARGSDGMIYCLAIGLVLSLVVNAWSIHLVYQLAVERRAALAIMKETSDILHSTRASLGAPA